MFDLFAWLCLVPPLPLFALALVVDGPRRPGTRCRICRRPAVCMLFLGAISTCIAYWLWGRLLRDYPAAQVVPFALLVPFVGSAASSIVFGEPSGRCGWPAWSPWSAASPSCCCRSAHASRCPKIA